MPTVYLAPDPVQSTFLIPGGNSPGTGVQLFCYAAGTTTKQSTYTNNTGNTAHNNPIVMDSGGNIPSGGAIWIPAGLPAKFVWAPSNDTDPPSSPYRTIDNVSGINDITSTEWASGPSPTFVNSSSFTLSGDQTTTFKSARQLKFSVTAGTVYGKVSNSGFATGSTTVNTAFNSGALDSGLTAVSYSLVDVNPSSINADYIHKKATAVPSASTTNIWDVAGDYVHITGNTQIGSFSTAPYAGAERDIIFDGTPTIVNSGNLLVPGAVNLTAAANDRAKVRADTTSSHVITFYEKSNGLPTSFSTMSFAISSDVALNSTATFFDGPFVSQGSVGTWLAMGTVTVTDTAGLADFQLKIHDGTTIRGSASARGAAANARTVVALSGTFTNPSGNIRISVKDASSVSGAILWNQSGNSSDSGITVVRIA